MFGKLISTTVMVLSASVALAQNAPPAGNAPPGAQGGGRMDPAARFKELDKNSDGKLSLDELSAAPFGRGGGAGGPPAGGPPAGAPAAGGEAAVSAADRFKTADANKDGSLSVEEFTAMIQSMRGAGGGGMGGGAGGGGGGMGGG